MARTIECLPRLFVGAPQWGNHQCPTWKSTNLENTAHLRLQGGNPRQAGIRRRTRISTAYGHHIEPSGCLRSGSLGSRHPFGNPTSQWDCCIANLSAGSAPDNLLSQPARSGSCAPHTHVGGHASTLGGSGNVRRLGPLHRAAPPYRASHCGGHPAGQCQAAPFAARCFARRDDRDG